LLPIYLTVLNTTQFSHKIRVFVRGFGVPLFSANERMLFAMTFVEPRQNCVFRGGSGCFHGLGICAQTNEQPQTSFVRLIGFTFEKGMGLGLRMWGPEQDPKTIICSSVKSLEAYSIASCKYITRFGVLSLSLMYTSTVLQVRWADNPSQLLYMQKSHR
jgi:hypothetical protein